MQEQKLPRLQAACSSREGSLCHTLQHMSNKNILFRRRRPTDVAGCAHTVSCR